MAFYGIGNNDSLSFGRIRNELADLYDFGNGLTAFARINERSEFVGRFVFGVCTYVDGRTSIAEIHVIAMTASMNIFHYDKDFYSLPTFSRLGCLFACILYADSVLGQGFR